METKRHLNTVVKSASLIFVGLVFSKILTYFYRLVLARYYGPEIYGLISIGLSIIGVLVVILLLGMDSGIVRYVSEYKAKNDEKRVKGAILTPFKISLPFTCIMTILIWFFSPSIAGIFAKDVVTQLNLISIFRVLSLTLPFTVCYNLVMATNKGFQQIKYNVYADNFLFSIILVLSLNLFSFFGDFNINAIVWSYVLTVILSFLFLFYYFNRHIFNVFNKTKSIFEITVLVKYSIPLFIGSIASILIGSFDTIFLGVLKTPVDVGIYNAALPTAKFILTFGITFGILFPPIVIEYKTKKMSKEILNLYRFTTKWIFFSGLPFTLFLVFFSKNILNILFGPEYTSIPAFSSLSILGIAFFIQSFLMISTLMLVSIDKTKYVMIDLILAVSTNLILNIVLIPYYGILGAAFATSISAVFVVLMDSLFTWKFTKMNPFDLKAILKSVLAGLISMSFIIIIFRFTRLPESLITFLPLFFIFLFVYITMLFIFKALDKNDIFILSEIEKKSGIKLRFIRKFVKRCL